MQRYGGAIGFEASYENRLTPDGSVGKLGRLPNVVLSRAAFGIELGSSRSRGLVAGRERYSASSNHVYGELGILIVELRGGAVVDRFESNVTLLVLYGEMALLRPIFPIAPTFGIRHMRMRQSQESPSKTWRLTALTFGVTVDF